MVEQTIGAMLLKWIRNLNSIHLSKRWERLRMILGKRRNQEKLKLEQTCKNNEISNWKIKTWATMLEMMRFGFKFVQKSKTLMKVGVNWDVIRCGRVYFSLNKRQMWQSIIGCVKQEFTPHPYQIRTLKKNLIIFALCLLL